MSTSAFLVVAIAILGFGLISRRLQKSVLTPPMAFVALGWLVSEQGLGLLHLHLEGELIHLLAEITLVMVLFTDAYRIDLGLLRREHNLPARLLLLGMPLCIALGAVVAGFLFAGRFTLWEAALLAAVLTPTDAALGQAVVSSPLVPVRIRQTINVESGLNDGIALPVVLVFMSLCASAVPGEGGASYWLRFGALQVTLGPLVGIAVGWIGGRLVDRASGAGWMNDAFQHLSALGLALLAFAAAEEVGGNGFIAAFCAGLLLGNVTEGRCGELYEFAEAEGQLLTLLVFLIFGAVMVPELAGQLGWRSVLYAVLSLTVIRMVPAALALLGAKLRWETVLFLGWFGPRGIASILFGLLVVERSVLAARQEILAVVVLTVLLSVAAHGLTAYPAAAWYARRTDRLDHEAAERREVSEMPLRIRQ